MVPHVLTVRRIAKRRLSVMALSDENNNNCNNNDNAESISEFRQSQLFQVNQKQVYKGLNGEKQGERIIRNSEDSIKFLSNILSIRKKHNRHAKWLKDCRKQFESVSSMGKVEISKEMVKVQCRKMSKSS